MYRCATATISIVLDTGLRSGFPATAYPEPREEMLAKRYIPALLAASFLLIGCASAAEEGGERSRRDSNLITAAEIASANASNLYDVVDRLRPRWLQNRAARTFDMQAGEIVVYQDQTYLGPPDVLRQMNLDAAYAMRYLDAATAAGTLPGIGGRRIEAAIVIYTSEAAMRR
jgi:hypothetical protein